MKLNNFIGYQYFSSRVKNNLTKKRGWRPHIWEVVESPLVFHVSCFPSLTCTKFRNPLEQKETEEFKYCFLITSF